MLPGGRHVKFTPKFVSPNWFPRGCLARPFRSEARGSGNVNIGARAGADTASMAATDKSLGIVTPKPWSCGAVPGERRYLTCTRCRRRGCTESERCGRPRPPQRIATFATMRIDVIPSVLYPGNIIRVQCDRSLWLRMRLRCRNFLRAVGVGGSRQIINHGVSPKRDIHAISWNVLECPNTRQVAIYIVEMNDAHELRRVRPDAMANLDNTLRSIHDAHAPQVIARQQIRDRLAEKTARSLSGITVTTSIADNRGVLGEQPLRALRFVE